MLLRAGRVGLGLLLAAGPLWAQGAAQPGEKKIITNYWEHLNEVLREYEIEQQRLEQSNAPRYTLPLAYPFDALEHLNGQNMLRAAHEGMQAARRAHAGEPQEVIDRAVLANLVKALEYYPLVASPGDSIRPFFYIIGSNQEDKVFRRFLLEQLSNRNAPSQFSLYFQDRIALESVADLADSILNIVRLPGEPSDLYLAALEALHSIYTNEILDTARRDPAVRAWEETGKPLDLMTLGPESELQISADTRDDLAPLLQRYQGLVDMLGKQLEDGDARRLLSRQYARAFVERILREVPLPNPAAARGILEQYPVESLQRASN